MNSLLSVLHSRFESNAHRHPGVKWASVEPWLIAHSSAIEAMESSAGEPDIVAISEELYVVDCSKESPLGRRSFCYDPAALESRKEAKPKHSAVGFAAEMGIELLTEQEYYLLQEVDEFDLKTSSWLLTPSEIREKGGAIFGDRRFGRTFIYHNGAESYYASRGFRGKLRIIL